MMAGKPHVAKPLADDAAGTQMPDLQSKIESLRLYLTATSQYVSFSHSNIVLIGREVLAHTSTCLFLPSKRAKNR